MQKKLTREELIKLVQAILEANGTQDEIVEWLELVEENVPHPGVSDLIYYPEKEMTAEEIVDTALNYKRNVITLPASFDDEAGKG